MNQSSFFGGVEQPKKPSKSFINTTKLTGKTLAAAVNSAKSQDENVLQIFQEKSMMSPSQCWRIYERRFGSILLTSLRRSISTLEDSGELRKTGLAEMGLYGRPEFVWEITKSTNPLPSSGASEAPAE